jgi:hypothetical protein
MAKKTLLKIVQDILSDMDADNVNSIDDTIESQQVAQIVESTYYEMLGNRNWPHLGKVIQLDSLSDLAKPNYLKLPDNLKELSFFKYEKQKQDETKIVLHDVIYKEPDSFLRFVSARNSDNDNVQVVNDFGGTKLLIFNDKAPSYWTSFDDTHLVTDSYDSAVESTLQSSKSQCQAYIIPSFTQSNSFIPDLPIDAFPALIEEAKSTAFFVLKQMVNTKAEQKASRQQRWLSRKSWRAKGGITYENYGRKAHR